MGSSLNALAASAHVADLQRAANGRGAKRAGARRRRTSAAASIGRPAATVRIPRPDEAEAIRRLAELDEAPELVGEILVATIDADVVAALALTDGRVVADPFIVTSGAIELLRERATEMTGRRRRRWLPVLRPRLA